MAIRAALNVARWLLFALFAIIKMHYSPSTPASSVFSVFSLPGCNRFFFLWKASLSSFPPSVSLSASRPFLRLFTLYVAENSTLAAGLFLSPSVFQHLPPPRLLRGMLVERKWEEEPLPPSSSFQFKFASAQERGAFHSQTRPCLSRLDQRRTFRHLINPADRRARVSKCRNVGTPNLKISCLFSVFFDQIHFSLLSPFLPLDIHVKRLKP